MRSEATRALREKARPPYAKLNQPVMIRFSWLGEGIPLWKKVQSEGQMSVNPFLGWTVIFWWTNCVPPSSVTSFRYVMKTRWREAPRVRVTDTELGHGRDRPGEIGAEEQAVPRRGVGGDGVVGCITGWGATISKPGSRLSTRSVCHTLKPPPGG